MVPSFSKSNGVPYFFFFEVAKEVNETPCLAPPRRKSGLLMGPSALLPTPTPVPVEAHVDEAAGDC